MSNRESMKIFLDDFKQEAKSKIEQLAMAIDSASHGLNSQSHPRAVQNLAIADNKLKKLQFWHQNLQKSSVLLIAVEDVAVMREFLDREILAAQSYLSGADENVSSSKWWGIALVVLLVAGVIYLSTS